MSDTPKPRSNEQILREALLAQFNVCDNREELTAFRVVIANTPGAPPDDVAVFLLGIDALLATLPTE